MTDKSLGKSNLNLRQALVAAGWKSVGFRYDLRVPLAVAGSGYGILERDGVKFSICVGQELAVERGQAVVYLANNSKKAILSELTVSREVEPQELAKSALHEISKLADSTDTTIFFEPPAEDGFVGVPDLEKLYSCFGFEFVGNTNRVMVRCPG